MTLNTNMLKNLQSSLRPCVSAPLREKRSASLTLIIFAIVLANPLAAQRQDTTKLPSGVRLRVTYQQMTRPKVAVRPFGGATTAGSLAEQVTTIIKNDLDFSDRFVISDIMPEKLSGTGTPDFKAWNSMGIVYLLTGEVAPASAGYLLHVVLWDVVYGTGKQAMTYSLPAATSPDFRLMVHRVSDDVVKWATGQQGMAASRIVYRHKAGTGDELVIIDSDGQGSHRFFANDMLIYSPTWSPDGQRIAYAQQTGRGWQLVERDVHTGNVKIITSRNDFILTPAYSPDGRHLAFALWTGQGTEIDDYDAVQRCCMRRISKNPRDDISPTYSPDGTQMAFMSNRIGQPHIYVMPANGGDPTLVSPYVYGEPGYYTSPDWSPIGNRIAFHGRSKGEFQIMTADPTRPGSEVQQITSSGRNEDPSWAPDGRHLVFTGVREGGTGLYVMDVETGRLRPLVLGGRYTIADWSPSLKPNSEVR